MEGKTKRELILVEILRGRWADYVIVDLGANEASGIPVASLFNEAGFGTSLYAGQILYHIGGGKEEEDDDLNHIKIHNGRYVHLGASCLELKLPYLLSWLKREEELEYEDDPNLGLELGLKPNHKWKPINPMQYDRVFPMCASLGGEIYVVGRRDPTKSSVGEVLIPKLNEWRLMDPPPSDLHLECDSVSAPVIADENNYRLLIHFSNANSLYAYYPACGIWDCLAKHLRHDWNTVAVADNVLYIHNNKLWNWLAAYDLYTKEWLNVKSSSEFPDAVYIFDFVDMLYMGNDIFCFAHFFPVYDEDHSRSSLQTILQFIKFRVERTSPGEVCVTLVGTQRIPLKGYMPASRFMLL